MPVKPDAILTVFDYFSRLAATFFPAIDDIDGHAKPGLTSQLLVLFAGRPFAAYDVMTRRFGALLLHPKPQGRPKSGDTVVTHQLGLLQKRKTQVRACLAIIVSIA